MLYNKLVHVPILIPQADAVNDIQSSFARAILLVGNRNITIHYNVIRIVSSCATLVESRMLI